MNRIGVAALVAALACLGLCTGGCSSSGTGSAGGAGGAAGSTGSGGSGGSGAGGGSGGGGTDACAQGCQHLQGCGLCITNSAGTCLSVQECASTCATYPTGPQVAQCAVAAGCDTNAISACVGPATGGGGSQCSGCYWDGSACTWCSTSDWGNGPYSGACSSCDATCCPGH